MRNSLCVCPTLCLSLCLHVCVSVCVCVLTSVQSYPADDEYTMWVHAEYVLPCWVELSSPHQLELAVLVGEVPQPVLTEPDTAHHSTAEQHNSTIQYKLRETTTQQSFQVCGAVALNAALWSSCSSSSRKR